MAPYRGITALMFRVANGRTNQLIELKAQVLLGRFATEDGRKVRRFDNLTLERAEVMFFPLSWTVVHPITADSPLAGATRNSSGRRTRAPSASRPARSWE